MAKLELPGAGLRASALPAAEVADSTAESTAAGVAARLSQFGQQLRHSLAHAAQRLPWQTSVGIALLAISLILLLGLALPQYYALQRLQLTVAQARQQQAQHPQPIPATPQTALQEFYASLPAESDMPKLIAVLMQAASEHGIQPDNAQYQIARSTAAAYSRYQITLPVHADYVALRKWMNTVLNRLPNAALNEIDISRDAEHEGQVEARVKLTFYLRHAR